MKPIAHDACRCSGRCFALVVLLQLGLGESANLPTPAHWLRQGTSALYAQSIRRK
jgi:hypothetical protein